MEFNHFLSSYYPDPSIGGKNLYDDMLEQAIFADQAGYAGVSIPEHHVVNILLNPAPLTFAVKVADHTKNVDIVTSIVALPLHDITIGCSKGRCNCPNRSTRTFDFDLGTVVEYCNLILDDFVDDIENFVNQEADDFLNQIVAEVAADDHSLRPIYDEYNFD